MDGYMIDVQWDGTTLTVHGKNKASRIALAGEDHARDVVLTRDQMAKVTYKPASMVVNGNLIIETTLGKRHQLHFRRKQRAGFEALARELEATH